MVLCRKQHMCIVLDELKNSLLMNAKDICIEILKNELIETLNCPVLAIKILYMNY